MKYLHPFRRWWQLCAAAILATTSAPGLHGAWTLIQDFEGYVDGIDATFLFPYSVSDDAARPRFLVYSEDPMNPNGNKGYWLNGGSHKGGNPLDLPSTFVSIPLPEYVEEGMKGTIYFRIYTEGNYNYWSVGTTATSGDTDEDPPLLTHWSEYATRLESKPSGEINAGVGSGRLKLVQPWEQEPLTWVEVWMLINNSSHAGDKSYRLYIRGPADPEPVELSFDIEQPRTVLPFHDTKQGSITAMVLQSEAFFGQDYQIWLIDDIYADTSRANLGNPRIGEDKFVDPFPEWNGYLVQSGGFVYTGNWLGTVYVQDNPWVYSYSMNKWIYAEDDPQESAGAWVWVSR